ncbi:MAG: PQQ-binding-like beta-propeller repeat protein, partial [Gemmataceae bacterium]
MASGSWESPPPVRRQEASTALPPSAHPSRIPTPSPVQAEIQPATDEVADDSLEPDAAPPAKGRIARWIIVPFVGLVIVGLGAGTFLVFNAIKDTENRLAASADADYDKNLFGAAGQKYAKLAKDFPESEQVERYQFRARLSELRNLAGAESDNINEKLQAFRQFIEDYAQKPILNEHAADLGDSVVQMLVSHAKSGLEDPLDPSLWTDLEKAETVLRMVRSLKAPKESRPVAWIDLEKAMEELGAARRKAEERRRVLTNLEALAQSPSYANLVLAESMLAEEGPKFPGLTESPKVKELLETLYAGHRASIKYVPRGNEPAPNTPSEEDSSPALLVGPLLAGSPGNPPPNDSVVLALSRGVLYGLSESTGQIRWARRLGIDTTTLPVRVPAGRGSSERILALSSDSARLDALDPDGNILWIYRLGTPSLGRPLVVGQRAYLATYNGDVHEIELNEGRLLGRFVLNHRLTTGGAYDPHTGLLYFPADDGCIYILRPGANAGCEQILYTRHLAASLRGEPILLPPLQGDPGYLVLNQTAGTRSTQLKVYELPIRERNASPRRLKMNAEMEGWTWFPPFNDPEKIALLTDAGMLGVFGIRQPGTMDQPLFPLLPEGGLRLSRSQTDLELSPSTNDLSTAARATIVQIEGEDYWTLGLGRLQRHRLVWDTRTGPRLVPVWRDAPLLGSPLHEGQVSAKGNRLVVVTQAPRSPATWATCVEERRGEIVWKRQLGLVCQHEPMPISLPEGPPLLLALDEGGSLFSIDPTRFKIGPNTRWLLDSRMTPLAGPLEENRLVPPVLIRSADGQSVYMVANPGAGKTLVIRHILPAAVGRKLELRERRVEIRDRLAGPPALVGNYLVMPLADSDETLIRVAINKEEVQEGPNWRLSRADPEAIGFVLPLSDSRFVTSDGGRGLTVWNW